jgi:hypothetical protein
LAFAISGNEIMKVAPKTNSWSLKTERLDHVIVFRFIGHLDFLDPSSAEIVVNQVISAARVADQCNVVLQFGRVNHMSRTSFDSFIALHKRLLGAGLRPIYIRSIDTTNQFRAVQSRDICR